MGATVGATVGATASIATGGALQTTNSFNYPTCRLRIQPGCTFCLFSDKSPIQVMPKRTRASSGRIHEIFIRMCENKPKNQLIKMRPCHQCRQHLCACVWVDKGSVSGHSGQSAHLLNGLWAVSYHFEYCR